MSWTLFFNTNLYGGAELTGAITATVATDPSQITAEGMSKLAEKLGSMKGKMDPELLTRLQLIASSTKEKTGKEGEPARMEKYGHKTSDTYSAKGGAQGDYHGNGAKGVEYGAAGYTGKKKKKDAYE